MEEILKDLAPEQLAAAIEASQAAFFRDLGRLPHVEVRADEGRVVVTTGVPFPLFNGVTSTRLRPEAVDAAIAWEVAHFAERGVPFFWWTGPTTAPADLGERLQAHGFVLDFAMPGMAADLRCLPAVVQLPDGVTIERVAGTEALARCVRVGVTAFGLPRELEEPVLAMEMGLGWEPDAAYQRYLGTLDGRPVACSSLYMGAGVVGLYTVGTVAEARRKGIGTAITLAPLLDARERGYRVGVLSASPMGEPVYRRMGFRDYCRMAAYVLPGEGEGDE